MASMTASRAQPGRTRHVAFEPSLLPLKILVFATGLLLVAAGIGLRGSSWILPQGVLAGGIALLALAPMARTLLDPLVVSCPFMFFVLVPGMGVATAGTSDVLFPLIVAILLATIAVRTRSEEWTPPGAVTVFAVLTGIVVVGSMACWTVLDPDFALVRAVSESAKFLIGAAYLVVVCALARRAGRGGIDHALALWGWTAAALSLASVIGGLGVVDLVPSDGYRSLGFFLDPNLYAGYLLVSLAVLLYRLETQRHGWVPLQIAVVVAGVVTTGSRGGLISLAVLLAFSVLAINSVRLRLWMLAGLGASVAGYLWLLDHREIGTSILGLDRILYASTAEDVSDDPRFLLWSLAIDKWLESPLFGIGAGQFERYSGENYGTLGSTGVGYVTHNTFLFFLVSFGVVGMLLFVALLAWIVRSLYRADGLTRNAKHALAAGVLVLVSQMMTLNLQNLRYVWIYLGVVLAIAWTKDEADQAGAANTSSPSSSSRASTGWSRPLSSGRNRA